MKWAFAVQSKIRLAIILAVLMLLVIIFSMLESYNMTRISRSFSSIYQDRLIPAVDLYTISHHIHHERDRLFLFLFTENVNAEQFQEYIASRNEEIDSLINKYERTYLVRAEENLLPALKRDLQRYRESVGTLITQAEKNKELARQIYLSNTVYVYEDLSMDLLSLARVQTVVGRELMNESEKSRAGSELISRLQMITAIILGIVILILVVTDKQVNVKQEKFRMN